MNKSSRPGVEEWRPIIDGQPPSGLSVAAYCRERGVTQGSFYTWKRRLRSPAPAFVEVKPSSLSAARAIEICLAGERRLLVRRGFDHELLIELVRALQNVA